MHLTSALTRRSGRSRFVLREHGPRPSVPRVTLIDGPRGGKMQLRSLIVCVVVACSYIYGEPSFAGSPEAAYRVLQVTGTCLPCGAKSYVVIDSEEKLEDLYTELKEECRGSRAPDAWRQSIMDLSIDFRDEAVVTMYEVIGTGGKPSLHITGPENGILRAAIAWDTGPPPYVPIATAACFTFAVLKSVVKRIDIMPGGVLNKTREELSLPVLTARPNKAPAADTPPRTDRCPIW